MTDMLESLARSRIDEAYRTIATYGPHIGAPAAKDDPLARCSVARMVDMMAKRGLHGGAEYEVCVEAARAAGVPYDPHRVIVPFAMLATRDVSVAASGGGYLVESDKLDPVDILRPFSVVARAGVTIAGGLVGNVAAPVTSATSTITWLSSETAATSPSAPTVSQAALTPHTARGVVPVSRNLMRQANAEPVVTRELLGTAGTALDVAALQGAGTLGEPLGVGNVGDVTPQAGASLAWVGGALTMKRVAAAANAADEDIAFIATPSVREVLEGRPRDDTVGSGFIWQDNAIAGCRAYATTNMPSATMLCGPMSRILVGLWGPGFQIEINPNDPTLFKSGVIQIAVVVTMDVGITCDPAAFTLATSIT